MIPSRLRDLVERVVDPVCASESRKDRMREELFAHLATSFEEELIHLGEESAAAERAVNRLGEAGELTRNLQDSVPWIERVMYTRLVPTSRLETYWRRRQDESLTRYATRTMFWMTASVAGADLVGVMVAAAGRKQPVDWPVACRLGRRGTPRDRRGLLRIPVPLRRDGSRARGRNRPEDIGPRFSPHSRA